MGSGGGVGRSYLKDMIQVSFCINRNYVLSVFLNISNILTSKTAEYVDCATFRYECQHELMSRPTAMHSSCFQHSI